MQDLHKWYVIQVISGREKRVKKALEENRENKGMVDLISEILVPTENVAEVKKGEHRISEKRLWPGYILVKMNLTDDSWMYVKNTNGVIGFTGGEKPVPLSEQEISNILQEMEAKKQTVTHKHDIQIDDKVKITDGCFTNFIGNVKEVNHDKGRLSVIVTIFGRDTCVEDLEFWQVERLPQGAET